MAPALAIRVAAAAMLCASAAQAATFNVNDFSDVGDSNPGNGSCSTAQNVCTLRAAIEETNALPSLVFAPDVIQVPGGNYLLSLGDLVITDHLRIIGARTGQATVVDGQHLDGVFTIDAARGRARVEFHFLRVQNGRAPGQLGGGINNLSGLLLVSNCRISGNDTFQAGGGIFNNEGSILSVTRTQMFDNGRIGASSIEPQRGGALYNEGIAYIDRSTINSNIAGRGAGIFQGSGGILIIRNTTITGNTGYVDTGGVLTGGRAAFLNNVTIAFNVALPEFGFTRPPETAAGGISGSNIFMANTIVANNRFGPPGSLPDRHDCGGSIVGFGYNLVFDPAGCDLTGDLTGNITGEDPLLVALSPNGGVTPTHALPQDSPAVNAGNPAFPNGIGTACEPTDQRSRARGVGPGVGRCDIGAYERGGAPGDEGSP